MKLFAVTLAKSKDEIVTFRRLIAFDAHSAIGLACKMANRKFDTHDWTAKHFLSMELLGDLLIANPPTVGNSEVVVDG